jgi:uncharacterized membrane protein YphA (DoxX/SURF4 family)
MRTRNILVEIICLLFIVLWVYAGLNKMLDHEFGTQLHRSPYLDKVADMVEVALPTGELLIALLLIFPRTKIAGLYASFFTMFIFTGYIYSMLKYSFYKPCSCGGILAKMDWHTHLYFNIAFTVLAAIGILLWPKPSQEPVINVALS